MAKFENDTKYPLTTNYIYSECAKRLKERKQSLKMTDAEIAAGGFDRKVVNRIINGTRTRNNPYLIPPAYVKPLVKNLRYENEAGLLWGDENDEGFIEAMFYNLVIDILDESDWNENYFDEPCWSKSKVKIDIIQKVLLDSVAYARVYPTLNSSYEYESPEGVYYPISPYAEVSGGVQVTPAERKQIRGNAIIRLFKNARPLNMFRVFFTETNERGENKGFSRLDGRLDKFLDNSLMAFMRDNIPREDSLGLRTYGIVSADIARYVEAELANAEREAAGFEGCICAEQDEVFKALLLAGKQYIEQIEDLQVRLDILLRKEKFGRYDGVI